MRSQNSDLPTRTSEESGGLARPSSPSGEEVAEIRLPSLPPDSLPVLLLTQPGLPAQTREHLRTTDNSNDLTAAVLETTVVARPKLFAHRAISTVSNFFTRPFREDKAIAVVYNVSCLFSTVTTAAAAFTFGVEAREAMALGDSLGDHAKFAGVVQLVSYGSFCAAYYPGMAWVKLRDLGRREGGLKKADYLATGAQCGVDVGIHILLVDIPCHVLGGLLQTAFTMVGQSTGLVGLRVLDTAASFAGQMLADVAFTPCEAPIWRASDRIIARCLRTLKPLLPNRFGSWLDVTITEVVKRELNQISNDDQIELKKKDADRVA